MASEWDDVLGALGLTSAPDAEPTAPPSALQTQIAGFPARGANLLMGALGPLGEAGMTLGDMLRSRSFDARSLPQIAGGVMLGTMAPGGAEASPFETAVNDLIDLPMSKAGQVLFHTMPVETHAPILQAMADAVNTSPETLKQQLLDAMAEFGQPLPKTSMTLGSMKDFSNSPLSDEAIAAKLAKNPGASIFDLAGTHVGGPSSTFTGSVPRIDLSDIPRMATPATPLAARVLGTSENLAHGTSQPLSRWMSPQGGGEALALPDDELGVHFGNPRAASVFTSGGTSDARTYPVVVATNNPLRMKDLGSWHLDRIVSELHRLNNNGGPYDGRFPYDELGSLETIGDARKYIASKGYDSVVYKNSEEDPGHDSYIKFTPSPVDPQFVSGVRSPFAKFDPQKLSWPELAAGLGGASTLPLFFDDNGQPLIRTK